MPLQTGKPEDGKKETHDDSRYGNDIGYNLMLEINEGDDHEGCRKCKIQKKLYTYPEPNKQGHTEQTGDEFHQGIAQGDGSSAFPAFAPEDDITEYRHIVIEPNFLPALGAMRGRKND
jgi:hypothetical protein